MISKSKDAEDRTNALIDNTQEKAIKRLIRVLFETLVTIDDSSLFARAYETFYAPQMKILSKLLLSELKYDGIWRGMTELRHGVDEYRKEIVLVLKDAPEVPNELGVDREQIKKILARLDGFITGTTVVFETCCKKLEKINEFLAIDRPHNIFDLTFGHNANFVSRNDLCDSLKSLLDENVRLSDYRNDWARLADFPVVRFSADGRLGRQCPDTAF